VIALPYFFATFAGKGFLLRDREEAFNRKVPKENIAKFAKEFLPKERLAWHWMTS
jgi:hypothetical protein